MGAFRPFIFETFKHSLPPRATSRRLINTSRDIEARYLPYNCLIPHRDGRANRYSLFKPDFDDTKVNAAYERFAINSQVNGPSTKRESSP